MSAKNSIQQTLLRHQIAVILLLGGTVLATTFLGAEGTARSLTSSIMERAVSETSLELELFFDPVIRDLALLREWGTTGLLDPADEESLQKVLVPFLADARQVEAISVVTEPDFRYRLRRSGRGFAGERDSLDFWPRSPGAITTAEGGQWTESRPEWLDAALSLKDSIDAGTAPRTLIHWTDPYRVGADEHYVITGAIWFWSDEGREAVAAFEVPLDGLSRFARSIRVTERGRVSIMTGDGRLIALPDDPLYWQGDPTAAILLTPLELRTTLVKDAVDSFAERPEQDRGTPLKFRSGGESWWGQVRPFELGTDRQLLIAVLVPDDDLWRDRLQMRTLILVITLLVLGLAIARTTDLARRLSRPIEALVRQSDLISRGDLEARENVSTDLLEVDRLAEAHHRMRAGLTTLLKVEGDLQLARQIQQKTLPIEVPSVRGFDIWAWSEPAEQTGGDTYDVIVLDPAASEGDSPEIYERVGLLLADASGHGIGPALSVTQVRSMLRMALRMGGRIGDVISQLNEQLFLDLPINHFVTAWFGVIDAESQTLTMLSAGQAPLLRLQAGSDEVEISSADVLPLGLIASIPRTTPRVVTMKPGDLFVVASDGCFEATGPSGEEYGRGRFSRVLLELRAGSAREISDGLRGALDEFMDGEPLADDRTILIVKKL